MQCRCANDCNSYCFNTDDEDEAWYAIDLSPTRVVYILKACDGAHTFAHFYTDIRLMLRDAKITYLETCNHRCKKPKLARRMQSLLQSQRTDFFGEWLQWKRLHIV